MVLEVKRILDFFPSSRMFCGNPTFPFFSKDGLGNAKWPPGGTLVLVLRGKSGANNRAPPGAGGIPVYGGGGPGRAKARHSVGNFSGVGVWVGSNRRGMANSSNSPPPANPFCGGRE